MNLISSPYRVPRPSYPFRGKFGRSGKGSFRPSYLFGGKVGSSGKLSFTDKAKIIDRGSLCSTPGGTGFKLQYEPYVFSVACS